MPFVIARENRQPTPYHDDKSAMVAEFVDVRSLGDLVPSQAGVAAEVRVHLCTDTGVKRRVSERLVGGQVNR